MKGGLVVIEGNIGAGKSTFAKILAESLNGIYIPEPDENTNPYLSDYYAHPARWSFEMQMYLLTRRYRAQRSAQCAIRAGSQKFFVMDRSYFGDVCFANVQRLLGYFDERSYNTYMMHHSDMKVMLEPPAMAIFLDVDPIPCKGRISKRMSEKAGRNCESSIDLDYLLALNCEIHKLAKSLEGKTIVKHISWNEPKTPDQIKAVCDDIATELQNAERSVYDFWTGIDGVGR